MKLRVLAAVLALSTPACELAFPIVLDSSLEDAEPDDAANEVERDAREHDASGDANKKD